MDKRAFVVAVAVALLLPAPVVIAQDKTQDKAQPRQTIRDRDIYGYQMMTPQERNAFRAKMRAAKTAEERERIRAEHHERMKERAKERGVTLPDKPRVPAGKGPGGGMGPGGGTGRGK